MTAKLTPATVRALLELATKGPWRIGSRKDKKNGSANVRIDGDLWIGLARVWVRVQDADEATPEGTANAALIASAPDLAAAYLEALAVIEEIAGTEWQEDEPASGWIPDGAEGYVGEMESFCNWTTKCASDFLAKHKEQEG